MLKKLLPMFALAALLTGCATNNVDVIPQHRLPVADNFMFPKADLEIDVLKTGRIDLDGDGQPEQIVVDSAGGTGGPLWHIRRINGEELSDTIQGYVSLAHTENGFPLLIVENKCGWDERNFLLYRFNGEKYICIRHELHNYKENKTSIENQTHQSGGNK